MEDQSKQSFKDTLAALLRSNRRHVRYVQALAILAAVVAFAVPLAMRQHGVAMVTTETILNCQYAGSGAHTHNADCYDADGNLVCPLPERPFHTHTADCYATERVLACGQEEYDGHAHSEACYDGEGNLTCTLDEAPGHAHTDACYETRATDRLVCGMEETTEEHVHGPACFETVTVNVPDPEPTVPAAPAEDPNPEQEFTGSLKVKDEDGNERVVLIAQVKAPQGALPKGSTMRVGHVDLSKKDESGVTAQDKLDGALRREAGEDAAFVHEDAVDIAFYDAQGNRVDPAKKVEVRITTSMIRTFSDQRAAGDEAVIDNSIIVMHVVDRQHTKRTNAPDAEVIREAFLVNQNKDDRSTGHEDTILFETDEFSPFVVARVNNAALAPEAEPAVADYEEPATVEDAGQTSEDKAEDAASSKSPAQAFSHRIADTDGNQLMRVDVLAPAGAFPLGTTMQVKWVDASHIEEVVSQAVAERTDGRLVDLRAVDITFVDPSGKEIEPAEKITVTFTSDLIDTADDSYVVHVDDEGKGEVVDSLGSDELKSRDIADQADELVIESDAFSTYVVAVTTLQKQLTASDGATYDITVDAPAEAGIPQGAELRVSEIAEGDEGYEEYLSQTLKALDSKPDEDTMQQARFFDISIVQGDEEIHPQAPVTVSVSLADVSEYADVASFDAVHFADETEDEKPEVLSTSQDEGVVSFETDGFSVFGVVYTVDFGYEINGKVYGFTMQGADSVSLRALIEALHVYVRPAENNADSTNNDSHVVAEVVNDDLAESEDIHNIKLDTFMEDIETVTFSNTELLVPAKVKQNTTAGQIKTDHKLFPTYPLGLTQAEVLALNAKEYEAGDWALISMKPFDTQETLTISMKNGDTFDIVVTDAQDAVMVGDVVQTISNPAGTTIDLFDYWIVSQEIAGRDGWGDLNQHQGAAEAGDDKPLNGSGNNKGINSSTSDTEHGHALKFSPAWAGTVYNGNKIGTTGNAWQSVNLDMRDGLNSYTGDEAHWHYNCPNPFTGIVQNNLYNGYPILTNNQQIGTTGESLAYLFNPSIAHSGKASYTEANQLLYVDKDGYYTYDSRDYAAAFDTGSKTFTLTEQTSTDSEIRGFWPFGTQNFWTGMHVKTQFSMPTGGQVLNPSGVYKPMQFEFSGDDDVWIYVDGILVGDAGGIHNRTEVDINFQTGVVMISGSENKYLDDLFRTGLRDQGKSEAEIEEYMTANFDGHTFKANTYHTFDFFYLERGGGESNLYIHYNLVSTADFTAHKSYVGADETDLLKRDQFKFELIGLDGKYRSVKNEETGAYELVLDDPSAEAIMPKTKASGEGTVASPDYQDDVTTTISTGSVNSQRYVTGVSEDGNVNFGTAEISDMDMHDADEGNPPVYKYIIREVVPDDAVNANGIRWDEATADQKAAGGFVKDQVTYDGTVYYMTGRVTSWAETDASGQEVFRHGISKTYYTDDTYTTVKDDVTFASFENRFTPDFGNVDFNKVNETGDALQGAVFTLYKDEACTVPATDLDTEGHPVWTATSDGNGKVSFENVRIGTYYMKETTAPAGYELDNTIYKVIIENSKDTTKESKITILGDESEAPVTEIANAKSGRISVLKKWLDPSGAEIDGGSKAVTVQLNRRHMVAEEVAPESHSVTVQMTVEDGGVHVGPPRSQEVTGDTVVLEWDDEWQRNFNWYLTVGNQSYEGWIGDEVVETENYTFEQIDNEGRSRRLTIRNVHGDVSLTTKYWVTWLHSDTNHWNNLNNPLITGASSEPTYVVEEDADFNRGNHIQALNSENDWSHTWSIGGTKASHSGYDFPARDENGKEYLYYVVELDQQGNAIEIGQSPIEGYTLSGYSPNNNIGVSAQGVITVYNQSEQPSSIDVVIRKADAETMGEGETTKYLDGAVFQLQAESGGSWITPANVTGIDSNGQFTVPTAGITLGNLTAGTYQLVEISAPDGYNIVDHTPVTFVVNSEGEITSTEGTISGVIYTAKGTEGAPEDAAQFVIPNPPGATLPEAGGPGTAVFNVCGAVLIAAGVCMFLRRPVRNW